MNGFTPKKTVFLCCAFSIAVSFAQAQGLTANNDILRTGPSQTVRKNIIRNDLIPGDTYSWELKTSPTTAQGTVNIQDDYLSFTPAAGFSGNITLQYELKGSGATDNADITIIVSQYNSPVNMIDSDVECYSYMQKNIAFDCKLKYQTSPRASSGDWIDAFTSPLVGDLNGDGKPEIVIMGNNEKEGDAADTKYKYINIYNGQTGERMYRYDFTALGKDYPIISMGSPWHRAPTVLALADLDGDGIGEIVFCSAENGRIAAFKPVFNGSTITGMNLMWEGHQADNAVVNYKSPAAAADFRYPNPYIADLNGDGIPEVIVYNKIFNGKTGALLMSWQNAASTPKYSSITSTSGLTDNSSKTPLEEANANSVKNVAMTGRRPGVGTFADRFLSAPAIVDIDGDGKQEIITGNRIHKFRFNSLSDHTQNTYTTIEGPKFVTVPEEKSNATYYYLSDGFTRVADIDGDGKLDIIVVTFGNSGVMPVKIVVYVWDLNDLNNVKACVSFGSEGEYGKFSIPFIGDINGKLDGYDGSNWTRKLPEICILGGGLYINRANTIANRTGVSIHPKSSGLSGKFNNTPSVGGHIIGLTWDDNATTVETKLKVSWGMEHTDRSDNTGITLFDFDNNNTADLCYRDETTLRIISPARSGKDYVTLGEAVSENSSVMFTKPVYSGTAFEYPVIADVNLDGSADIVVTNIGSHNTSTSRGWIEVYEYKGQKWAPCPPVWNQGMYDPTQVREDLKINARPISMLTEFEKNGEIIRPYNGSWMQTPITREGDDFVPVVRKPDAILTNMTVSVISATVTKVTLTIRNDGSASISASTPIAFYDAGTDGKDLNNGATTLIGTQPVGVDIFPDEKVTVEYTIGGNFNDHLIWAQVMDNGSKIIPANGYDDCNITNNTLSGIDCPYLKYTVAASPDSVLCGTADNALLTATPNEAPHHTTQTYQWYRNDVLISGATLQTYTATLTGEYKCFVTDNICRGFSTVKTITRNIPTAVDDHITVRGIPTLIDVLKNDIKSQYCSVSPAIASEDEPKNGTAVVQPDGSILYTPNTVTVETKDSIKYTIADSKATVHITLLQIPQVTLPDTTILCISSELRTTKVNVMANDPPNAEGNTVYLTGAEFVDASDATLAYITVNPADSTVTLTVKQDVYVGVEGHTFDIIYHVKDNGLPASQYAIGRLAVKTYPTPSYPDIRVRVCPDAGNINLSKYLDTINGVKTNGIQWSSQIQGMPITSPAGTVSTDNLSFARVHTFAYTLGSVCVSEQQRKVYLEMLKNNRINIFRDTVVMCYRYADAVQIDQLFGIEANGKLSYPSAIDSYVKKSSDYGGTVMNGKKIYENDAVPDSDYHGVTVKKIEFKYTPDTNSCLSKTYTIVIVLTPDLLN